MYTSPLGVSKELGNPIASKQQKWAEPSDFSKKTLKGIRADPFNKPYNPTSANILNVVNICTVLSE